MDYRSLPKLRDSTSFIYTEYVRIDREQNAISLVNKDGIVPVPASDLTLLMLGPGTTITHEAIKVLAANGCAIVWTGDGMVRYYAHGLGETRKGYKLERQARVFSAEDSRMRVVRAMYAMRLGIKPRKDRTIEQLRGMEGARVRHMYAEFSRETGVPWSGRNYNRGDWHAADPINRALSAANACLYGIVHAAIVTGGYSAGLGFIHRGKQLSFVYDIADLYKAGISVSVAFQTVKEGPQHLERQVRKNSREAFRETKLLQRILPDIERLLDQGENEKTVIDWLEDEDPSRPLPWWTPGATGFRPDGQEVSPSPPVNPEQPSTPTVAGPDRDKPGAEDF